MLIFDSIRRRYVALTPEEWVRQHFVHYLTDVLGYPADLIRNEAQLRIDRRRKRCDTVVYDTNLRPIVLCEYKAPSVSLTQKTMDQILCYNFIFHVPAGRACPVSSDGAWCGAGRPLRVAVGVAAGKPPVAFPAGCQLSRSNV